MEDALYTFTGTEYVSGVRQDIELEVGGTYSYGDFHEHKGEVTEDLKKSLFIMPRLMQGSDYSGGSVQRSNHRTFIREYGEVEGVYNVEGGFNTYAAAIRLDVYESNAEIKKTIDNLEDYALIDEEDHSALESEWEGKYMTNVLVVDICRNLDSHGVDLESCIPEYEKLLEDKETIEHLAWDGISGLSIVMEHENTCSYLKDEEAEKLQTYVEDRLLLEHCPVTNLPLLINREWSCEETSDLYKEKLCGGSDE